MAKQNAAGIKVTSTIECVGTIDAIGSTKSTGGGWKVSMILNDPEILGQIGSALKKVCVFSIGVSESEAKKCADENQLELDDIEGDEA